MTVTELRRKVLEKLEVVASGEPVHAADSQVVQGAYESLHEVLLQDNLVEWTVTEEIPDGYQGTIVSMVAAEVVDEFHCPPDLKSKVLIEGKYDSTPPSIAERRLRKLAAPGYSGDTAESEYF